MQIDKERPSQGSKYYEKEFIGSGVNFIRPFKHITLFLTHKYIDSGLCKLNVVKFRCTFCLVENISKLQTHAPSLLNLDSRDANGCSLFGGFMFKDH